MPSFTVIIGLGLVALLSYIVFVLFGEHANPFVKPKAPRMRRLWRYGRRLGLVTFVSGCIALFLHFGAMRSVFESLSAFLLSAGVMFPLVYLRFQSQYELRRGKPGNARGVPEAVQANDSRSKAGRHEPARPEPARREPARHEPVRAIPANRLDPAEAKRAAMRKRRNRDTTGAGRRNARRPVGPSA